MSLPDDLPQRPAAEAARRLALEQLSEVEREARRLTDASDGDGLHDFRVALRRLRSLLGSWRCELEESVRKKDRKALRQLQEATGDARDAEVARAWVEARAEELQGAARVGAESIAARLRERSADIDSAIARELQERLARVAERLHGRLERRVVVLHLGERLHEPSWARALGCAVARAAHELKAALEEAGTSSERGALHAARIRGKRLRYLLEPARTWSPHAVELVERMRGLQDVLGQIQDAYVLSDLLADAGRGSAEDGAELGRTALARLNRERLEALLERLRREWLAGGLARLLAEIEDFARVFGALGRGVERERRFLLERLPDLPAETETHEIEQGWLPGVRLRERLRRVRGPDGERFERALKLGAGVERTEIEEPLPRELFDALWPLTEPCRIRKRRHRVRWRERVWELDEFLDRPLAVAEVEIERSDERPDLPPWLAPYVVREVTDEGAFTNLALAEGGPGHAPR